MTSGRFFLVNFALVAGYLLLKSSLMEVVPAERLVALGGLYHWSALMLLAVGWSAHLIRSHSSTGSAIGDLKLLGKPLMMYALLASLSVWAWNHGLAADSTELKVALQKARVMTQTETEADYVAFLEQSDPPEVMPDRLTFREQALEQIEWMNAPAMTLAMALVVYMAAGVVLTGLSVLFLHKIWNVASVGMT